MADRLQQAETNKSSLVTLRARVPGENHHFLITAMFPKEAASFRQKPSSVNTMAGKDASGRARGPSSGSYA